jgi:hypothetical protein
MYLTGLDYSMCGLFPLTILCAARPTYVIGQFISFKSARLRAKWHTDVTSISLAA